MTKQNIPDYFVYGEPTRSLDVGFLHVELVSTRKNLHRGEVAAHKHPQMAQITYWIKGGGTYHIEDSSWRFSAPAISFIPSEVVHGFSVSDSSDAIVVSIANDAVVTIMGSQDRFLPKPVFLNEMGTKQEWQNMGTVMSLLQREHQAQYAYRQEAMIRLVGVILTYIARHNLTSTNDKMSSRFPLAQRLQQLVNAHFRENWTIEHYAQELNTTYHLLDKAAQNTFGKPVKKIVLQRRLLEAKRLLQFTIRSSEDISHELGFKDPAYFNREFKKNTGEAPGAWRRQRG